METNPNFLAPCGLYCGVCAVYYATKENNLKFKERLVDFYEGKLPGIENLKAEDIHCEGCLSDHPFVYCRECSIKDCTKNKGYSGCHECGDFPCQLIEDMPMPVGKKVILRTIPYWKKWGTEKYVADEEARYTCPECGHKIFRGAKRCNVCKGELDLD